MKETAMEMAAAPAAAAAEPAAAPAEARHRTENDSPFIIRKPGRGFQTSPAKKGGREAAFCFVVLA